MGGKGTGRRCLKMELMRKSRLASQENEGELKTVDKHPAASQSKLDIHDVSGLTRYAIADGVNKAMSGSGLLRLKAVPRSN